jgi:nitrate reductase assembly molybdenum cofactor insertion protein NarJ
MLEVTLEDEEWYVLSNWLRERENRLMYALRPKSGRWEFVHDLRRAIERQQEAEAESAGATETGKATETAGTTRTVPLSNRQVTCLSSFPRRRARKLLLFPWRSRERRDVRHLRAHLLEAAKQGSDATARSPTSGRRRG